MDLKTLREKGGIVSPDPVRREVSWTHTADDGSEVTDTFTVHIVRHSFGTIERLFLDKGGPDSSQAARFISRSVLLGEAGDEPIPYELAFQLAPELARVLMDAISEVNGTGSAAAKN